MTPQKKLILFLCLGLIALLLFAGLVIYPLIDKIRVLSQEYLSNQEILIKLDQRECFAKELQKNYQEKEADLVGLASIFLSPEETVGFISNLETIAQQTGNLFEIKAVSSHSPSVEEKKPFLNFQISLVGDFFSLVLFLANLEDSPYPPYRLVEIDNLTIKKLKEGDLETVLSVKIYTQ